MGHQEQLPFGCSPELASRVLGELLSMTRVNCCHVLCVGSGSKRIVKEFPAISNQVSILILSIILTLKSSSHSMHLLCVPKKQYAPSLPCFGLFSCRLWPDLETWRILLPARCASARTKWAMAGPSAPVKSITISASVCAACRTGKKHSGKVGRNIGQTISPMQLV